MDDAAGISAESRAQLARLTGRGRPFVTVRDAVARLELSPAEAAKKLSRWAQQGWLRRVRRGLYIAVPVDVEHPDSWTADPLVTAVAVWSPCYFTGWTAGNHWGLTEQIFKTVILRTSHRVRARRQRLLDHEYIIGNVSASKLAWGLRTEWISGVRIHFADEARVIVDVLDDPIIGGGIRHCADMLINYMAEYDPDTLIVYAERLGNAAVLKRLGYLCDILRLTDEPFLEQCEQRLTAGIALLDPAQAGRGDRNARWRLRVNVDFEDQATS